MSSICFVCELPVLSHQTWNTWKTNLLTANGPISSAGNYVNNVYHEDCIVCAICCIRLKQNNDSAKRLGNKIYCALHYSDVSGIGTGGEEFMNKLRDFKRQSLGCAEARRKSSTTLTFPIPVQACPGSPYCGGYPHDVKPTAGYWIECRGGIKESEIGCLPQAKTDDFLAVGSLPRSNTSEALLTSGRLEKQETSRSTSDMMPLARLQPPTIQIIESQTPRSKDDIELCRKHPNIIITIAQPTSPPPSPPAPSQQDNKADQNKQSPNDDPFELISFQEEIYEKHYHGKEHWNYFSNDESLGPVILSLKQQSTGGRDQFRVLLRTVSYSLHGLVPASSICADRYDREAVVRALGDEAGLKPMLVLGQLPSTPDELLKLDQVFVKSELKVGVIYIKENQTSEEAILGNRKESEIFAEFLEILGDRIRLKGFDKYKGGLDTVHDLTGTESVYTAWKGIEIMFHVSTMLPHEENDPQKLQKKRHIGNDIVCVAFMETDDTPFWPGCIKSHFLHAFIVVKTSPKPLENGETRKYTVSVVCRDEVAAFKPYLWHESTFEKGSHLREWLLTKIINGERASYSAPKFARMQDRTRSQMLEDIVTNLANHLATGQIPKPYRRGSWRPIGHMRPSSPLLDSVRDLFEGYDQLGKDFANAFYGNAKMICDVVFNVMGNPSNGGTHETVRRIYGVRAILAIRSRVFLEMLYGFTPIGPASAAAATAAAQNKPNPNSKNQHSSEKPKMRKRGSITAETIHKIAQIPKIIHPSSDSKAKRKESVISTSSSSIGKTPTYLTVPGTSSSSSSGGGGIKAAISRLVSGSWAGWGSKGRTDSMKRWQSESIYAKTAADATQAACELPGLSVCADVAKIDRNKLAQTEFTIIEFDGDTFQTLIEYLHSGSCPLTCETIPGLICAAEHFDLPDLLQACFHHTKTHLRLSVVPSMLNQLENYYWRYNSASQLVNTILKFLDSRINKFFARSEFLTLSESMISSILSRPGLHLSETRKFQIMLQWAMNTVTGGSKRDSLPNVVEDQPDKLPPNKMAELKAIMNRLTRDLKFHKIPPQELIKVVLPSKTITHERIVATLLYQADTGIYHNPNYANFAS
ncbi:rap GTPase-activating-like protein [Leptotrombidium deliense]|uniref:Rap GTPase-activating-like protein n=1 Tax=Leptotrombidium deliense TaxID=299467 RepID=A0A443SIK1_9ACAR|nr:rap GTPase-activating-like protein [Leptotrombidium deliense]